MPDIDPAEVDGLLAAKSFIPAGSDTDDTAAIPGPWRAIAAAPDARTRCEVALALWNEDFTATIPRFWAALTASLADVRVAKLGDFAALVYVGADSDGGLVSWFGWDPATFDEPPPFWELFPEPLQRFLQEVHAGFTNENDLYGPMQPDMIETLASLAGEPDGLDDWDTIQEIPSTRLLVIAAGGANLRYCLSPDLPPTHLALVYAGDADPQKIGPALDDLMLRALRP